MEHAEIEEMCIALNEYAAKMLPQEVKPYVSVEVTRADDLNQQGIPTFVIRYRDSHKVGSTKSNTYYGYGYGSALSIIDAVNDAYSSGCSIGKATGIKETFIALARPVVP